MLRKNLDSERGSEDGKRAGHFWTKPLRTLISPLTFVALFPVGLAAQATPPPAPAPPPAVVLGSGAQTPLQFEGESLPANQVTFSLGTAFFYDDNVLAKNSQRLSDEAVSFDSHLGITKHSERLTVSLDYMPFFLLYRQIDQYDRVNHSANLNLAYRLSPRVILGLQDTFSYQSGIYTPLTAQAIMSGPASPTGLNLMIIPYTIRGVTNTTGVALTFVKSGRTSFTFIGGYNRRKFGKPTAGQPLYNGNGESGGLQYQYRVTERTSFGILVLHLDNTCRGGQYFGNQLRYQIESAFLSLGSRLSPTVTVTVFGGPQYISTLGLLAPGISLAEHFQGSGGGSITKQVRSTAVDLSFQRSVSDSGGLYTFVMDSFATLGVRQRLVGKWEADLYGGAARADASLFKSVNGRTDALIGGINLNRPFLHGSVFRISYDTTHQLSKGTLPIAANFDRNQVAAGIDYQFGAFHLGR